MLFHGPLFQSIRSLLGISRDGAEGTVIGGRDLGWPAAEWKTDPAAVDGGLQLAVLWAERVLGGASLPMSVSEFRVYQSGPLEGPARCVVRARQAIGGVAECDVALIDTAVRVELRGVSLVRRPD
ncbi:polyketide synthase dehydratase domain-containing protein [Amycolatopsis sp. EV170708-02-1]|uniref:polyketide synthase dehydratase domain-containing protein n=1 Tax=Amycolatopsis sp. EV170708-02-1 TaxID=2919322 RepID=UPI001F0B8077|nr:polyketide synthase dehydratase domain-containing protein [Amycolatopsis sp. EV170708-02-1]UMP06727.1 polyketide synthase dehydratase domain-containing protein [Amycolatopsis sp. EV170708-02-1]